MSCKNTAFGKIGGLSEAIRLCHLVHGGRHDYSMVGLPKSLKDNVNIICRQHGPFSQSLHTHLKGHGCRRCSDEAWSKRSTISIDEFIRRARLVHGEKYIYSEVVYINSSTAIEIICRQHGRFKQNPAQHISGRGCQGCAAIRRRESLKGRSRSESEAGRKCGACGIIKPRQQSSFIRKEMAD